MARQLMDDAGNNLWPEFLEFLFLSAINNTPKFKESALQMFGSFPGIFGNQQSRYLNVIKQILEHSMADWSNHLIRYQAVKSFSAFILQNRNDVDVQQHFQVNFFCLFVYVQTLNFPIFPGFNCGNDPNRC
jgi:hypothetical protein